jgi:uncharacterized protein (DUF1697 family)
MPVLIAMLRGVNLLGRNKMKMEALRALCESLKFENPRTHVQSGNVIFRTKEKHSGGLAKKIQSAIEHEFGFRPEVILRTAGDLRKTVAANPFADRQDVHPSKLLVTFLAGEPSPEARTKILSLKDYPEEIHLHSREVYIYFPNGVGKSRLPWASVERLWKTTGTARNWNSVTKMLAIAEKMEAER